MLDRLAIRTPKAVLAVAVPLLVICAAAGGAITDRPTGGGFWDANSESARAERVLADRYAEGPPNFVILVTAPGDLGSAAAAAVGTRPTADLRAENGVAAADADS